VPTLRDELRDLARQLEAVHRKQWTPAQWQAFERLYLEFLEPLTPEQLEAYALSMQEWLEGAEAMECMKRRAGTV
jgi:hypothetical protein